MSHPYFEGLDWENVKTGETLYTPKPYSVSEECTVNFESRQGIYPFTKVPSDPNTLSHPPE